MSDPNPPYGAVPPSHFPPPGGPPPGGPPAGGPPPPPPPPPGASDKGKGLWIALAVLGVLALAAVVTGLVLLLTGDDGGDDDARDDATTSAASTSSSSDGTGDDTDDDDATASTDSPSGSVTAPTIEPTDTPSDTPSTPGKPRGTSTADQVANEPAAVVEAFIESVFAGDCATAEDLVTKEYLREEGGCDSGEVPTTFKDQVEYDVGEAKVDQGAGTATVPVTISAFGESEKGLIELQRVDGRWLISDDGED